MLPRNFSLFRVELLQAILNIERKCTYYKFYAKIIGFNQYNNYLQKKSSPSYWCAYVAMRLSQKVRRAGQGMKGDGCAALSGRG